MKVAQEIRVGNVIMQGKDPMIVLRTEYSRGGRGAATVRMKLKALLSNMGTESGPKRVHLLILCRPHVCVHGH